MVQNLRAIAHLSRQLGRWGAGRACVRQALGVRGRAGATGARAQRQAELAVGWASGSSAQGAQQAGRAAAGRAGLAGRPGDERQARGQAWLGCAGARGWAQGARGARPTWAWPGRWMGGRLGQLGQFWCTVHLAQFWLGFWTRFDSVFSRVTK